MSGDAILLAGLMVAPAAMLLGLLAVAVLVVIGLSEATTPA